MAKFKLLLTGGEHTLVEIDAPFCILPEVVQLGPKTFVRSGNNWSDEDDAAIYCEASVTVLAHSQVRRSK